MQRGRTGFLRPGQNEIEPLDLAPSASKHRRNVIRPRGVGEAVSSPYKFSVKRSEAGRCRSFL
ncbi:MAG: hypothetical protein DMF24_12820 [Verrucomicrobia bacterium]|nr:MAG: hypothetical protein DMF24_12820 [Verrucomicrobiota bacterium]